MRRLNWTEKLVRLCYWEGGGEEEEELRIEFHHPSVPSHPPNTINQQQRTTHSVLPARTNSSQTFTWAASFLLFFTLLRLQGGKTHSITSISTSRIWTGRLSSQSSSLAVLQLDTIFSRNRILHQLYIIFCCRIIHTSSSHPYPPPIIRWSKVDWQYTLIRLRFHSKSPTSEDEDVVLLPEGHATGKPFMPLCTSQF